MVAPQRIIFSTERCQPTRDNFCCSMMSESIVDPRIPLDYSDSFREHYIEMEGGISSQNIRVCPWCGSILPTSLRSAWFAVIDQLGLGEEVDILNTDDPRIPSEMQSDEWWLRRGL